MISKDEAYTRVAKGAAHLDTVRPGWFNGIDTGLLSLESCDRCIAAQLAVGRHSHPFTVGLSQLGIDDMCISAFGMGLGDGDCEQGHVRRDEDANFARLQDAWIDAIAARRHPVSEGQTTRELVTA